MTNRIAAAVALMTLTPGAALATGRATGGLTALGDLNLIVLVNMAGATTSKARPSSAAPSAAAPTYRTVAPQPAS